MTGTAVRRQTDLDEAGRRASAAVAGPDRKPGGAAVRADGNAAAAGADCPCRVLIVEDEPQMLDIIDYILTGGGYETRLAASAEAAWPLVKAERFDLIVCDIMLPRSSGLSFCRRVRELDQTPVCFLSALGTAEERVAGLEAGADDYIVKPFNARELLMRLQAILRRYHAGAAGPAVVNGPLQLWPQSNQAVVGRRRVLVSDSEMRLLRALAAARGRPVAWRELVALAWLTDAPETGQAMLKTAVHRLRAKLGDHSPPLIVAVRGKGYVMPDLG